MKLFYWYIISSNKMKLSLVWGILVVIVNVQVLRSDPSINIEHMKKTEARNNTVKKHPAKLDHHHEFNHKKEFHRGKNLSNSDEKTKTETSHTNLTTTDAVIHNTIKDNQTDKDTTTVATSNVTTIPDASNDKHKEPKAEKVKANNKAKMVEDEEDGKVTKSGSNTEKESNEPTLKTERSTDAMIQTDKHTATETAKASTMKEIQEQSSNEKSIKSSEISSEDSEKSPKADAVKAEKRYKLQNRIEHMRTKKKHGKKVI